MWSDRETQHDCLGFSSNVEVLSALCLQSDVSPLTLGIYGSWGSGKSSLMTMIRCRIEEHDTEKKVLTLWFNAWRYEGRDEAQSALIHAILAKLKDQRSLSEKAGALFKDIKKSVSALKFAKTITKSAITLTPDIQGFLDSFEKQSESVAETMESFEKKFAELVEELGLDRIVVFIDDLDRCSSQKVIETFETIKLFLNIPECTFVIGADPDKIERAIVEVFLVRSEDSHKAKPYARDYMEKIVTLPFRIPEQGFRHIACYTGMLILHKYLSDTGWQQLVEDRSTIYGTSGEIHEVLIEWATKNKASFTGGISDALGDMKQLLPNTETLARGLRGNPRQIKRALNILGLRQLLSKANGLETQPKLLVKLTVLEYVWKDFFDAVSEAVDPRTGKTDLFDEVIKAAGSDSEKGEESETVSLALEQPGLVAFIKADPELDSDTDLAPYLFLAQTALESRHAGGPRPADEEVSEIVERIMSDDRFRSKAASIQAASKPTEIVRSIVRRLETEIPNAKNPASQTHALIALRTICDAQPGLFELAVSMMSKLPQPTSDAVSLTAGALLDAASKHVTIAPTLRNRFKAPTVVQAVRRKRDAP